MKICLVDDCFSVLCCDGIAHRVRKALQNVRPVGGDRTHDLESIVDLCSTTELAGATGDAGQFRDHILVLVSSFVQKCQLRVRVEPGSQVSKSIALTITPMEHSHCVV